MIRVIDSEAEIKSLQNRTYADGAPFVRRRRMPTIFSVPPDDSGVGDLVEGIKKLVLGCCRCNLGVHENLCRNPQITNE